MDRSAGSGTIFATSSSNPPSAPNAVSHLLIASDVDQFAGDAGAAIIVTCRADHVGMLAEDAKHGGQRALIEALHG